MQSISGTGALRIGSEFLVLLLLYVSTAIFRLNTSQAKLFISQLQLGVIIFQSSSMLHSNLIINIYF